MAVAFAGFRFSSSDETRNAIRQSPIATSGFVRSSCIALVSCCSAVASGSLPDGPISCGLLCQTFAYGEVAHPASINAVPINHKRTLHQCTPFPVCNLGLFGCKHVRLSDRVPDRRIIRNDHGGSRFKFISEFVSEL